jgi:hypothetical protein
MIFLILSAMMVALISRWAYITLSGLTIPSEEGPTMKKKDTFVVRSGRSGSFFTLPSGVRVHTLNRATFERAVGAANTYISKRGSSLQQSESQSDRPVTRRERI